MSESVGVARENRSNTSIVGCEGMVVGFRSRARFSVSPKTCRQCRCPWSRGSEAPEMNRLALNFEAQPPVRRGEAANDRLDDPAAERVRQSPVGCGPARDAVGLVAGEQFVTPLAGEHHFHGLARSSQMQ